MPVDMHEEEQIEAIKKWWDDNGRFIVLGAGLGFALLFGWRYLQSYQIQQAEIASLNYEQAIMAENTPESAQIQTLTQSIKIDHSDSLYAVFASFLSAEQAVKAKQFDAATDHLNWAINHAKMPALVQIAHLRLARVKLAAADYDTAAQQLALITDINFTALKADIQGDIFIAQARFEEAKGAYDTALSTTITPLKGKHRMWVQNKRDQFGQADLKLVQAPAFAQVNTIK